MILIRHYASGNGWAGAFKQIKSVTENRDIPVIMLTAKGAEYDKVKALDAGADDYVTNHLE